MWLYLLIASVLSCEDIYDTCNTFSSCCPGSLSASGFCRREDCALPGIAPCRGSWMAENCAATCGCAVALTEERKRNFTSLAVVLFIPLIILCILLIDGFILQGLVYMHPSDGLIRIQC